MVQAPSNAELLTRMLPPCLPADRMLAAVDSVLGAALRITGIMHDLDDPAHASEIILGLDRDQQMVLPYVLAAMVDVDKTPGELLAWVPGYAPPKRLARVTAVAPKSILLDSRKTRQHDAECGTHNGFLRHIRDGEPVDIECGIAEKAWRRTAAPKRRKRTVPGQFELPGLELVVTDAA